VRRLEQLHAFGRITAPFDGVVTARNTDVGALIDSGSNAKELFHVAAVHRLRVFVNVPEIYSRAARPGMKAELTLTEFPGRPFTGTLARTAQSIDVSSRTLLTEIDVENPRGELLPGSYAEVHLQLPTEASTFKLPVNAVIFGTDGVKVAVVRSGGRVALQPVTLGRDYGTSLEVLTGLNGDEQVIVNPADSIEAGQTVHVAAATPQ
jgi:RND family efflux transporter MFP subunit